MSFLVPPIGIGLDLMLEMPEMMKRNPDEDIWTLGINFCRNRLKGIKDKKNFRELSHRQEIYLI